MNYLSMLQQGGPVIVLIGICALIAAFIFIQKWFEFYRAQMNVNEIVTGLINVLRRDGMIEAITLCDNSPGPVPRVLSSAIRAYKEGDDIRDSLATQTLIEVPRLESRLNILATLAYQCSCLENPRDGGAWWAPVYGVAQSRTRLKRLSSSSSIPMISRGD